MKYINKKEFKIRSSAINVIMGELTGPKPLTELQEKQLAGFIEKDSKDKRRYTLEAKKEEYENYIPTYLDLPEGAKKYARDGLKKTIYGVSDIHFGNKYIDKGIYKEDDNVKYLDPTYENNKKQFENEWITGEPDIIIKDKKQIRDLKSSGDYSTFPLFEFETLNKDYEGQGLGYMDLLGYEDYGVDYVLSDTPDFIIQKEYWRIHNISPFELEIEEFTEHYKEFRKDYLYDDAPRELRIRSFKVDYDKEKIELIHQRVEMIREYLKTL